MSPQEDLLNQTVLAANFMGQFNGRHLILFAGLGASQELLQTLSRCQWSCVLTSRTDDNFGDIFAANGRIVQEYSAPNDIPVRPLSKQGSLPILRLFGLGDDIGDEIQTELELTGQTIQDYQNRRAGKMLDLLPGLFDGASIMVVVGYSPSMEKELGYSWLATTLRNPIIPSGCVQFWGLDESEPQIQLLHKLADTKNFIWYTDSLYAVLQNWGQEFTTEEDSEPDKLNQIFYKGKKSEIIATQELLRYSHVAELITEQKVYAIRPYGRVMQAKMYYNFLTRSTTDGPQWYGYLRSSEFYLRRDYEEALVKLVRNQLFFSSSDEASIPIILYGDPGSSKSIILGALAYRVFIEKVNPVIFIKNDALVFSSSNSASEDLSDLMARIESIGNDSRILVIWDCSSYRNIIKNALRLSKILQDKGRRFVLVCTAYDNILDSESTSNIEYKKYTKTDDKFEYASNASQCNYDYCYTNNCYFVHSQRALTDHELNGLWNKVAEFSGIDNNVLKQRRNQIQNSNLQDSHDIFYCYYNILALLRPNLEKSLTREEKIVEEYVVQQMSELGIDKLPSKPKYGPIYYALQRAGCSAEELNAVFEKQEDVKEAKSIDLTQNIMRFNTCIALFGRFKLEVPYSLAAQVFLGQVSQGNGSELYNGSLYRALTTKIPWIYYGESKSGGDYVFSYRNSFEAELFLIRNHISGAEQVETVCNLLEMYGSYYHKNGYSMNEYLGTNLQQMIRLMGPNSQYPPFHKDEQGMWKSILCHIDKIILALHKLCEEYKIPDEDVGFATLLITFTREYYGRKWEELHLDSTGICQDKNYEERIQKIQEISVHADRWRDHLDTLIDPGNYRDPRTRHLIDQRNGLSVELAQCNIVAKQLQRELNQSIDNEQNRSCTKQNSSFIEYPAIYKILSRIILENPNNGHAYNTLFSAFEEEYEHGNLNEATKLRYLTEIKLIADDCINLDVQNRGSEDHNEIREHLSRIAEYCDNHKVTIEEIRQNKAAPEFTKLYNDMLDINSPSAIIYVCQQELKSAGIDTTADTLNDYQVMVCNRVMTFMQETNNRRCIDESYHALNFLLRVTWMYYTKRRLNGSRECQTIYLNSDQWTTIQQISNACVSAGRKNGQTRPLDVLVLALATLELTGNYERSLRIIKSIAEDQFYYQPRMKVPFIYCNETSPFLYTGTVIDIKGNGGKIRLSNVPENLCNEKGIRFYARNIGQRISDIKNFQRLQGLELGIGYTGFSLYTEDERKQKEAYCG